MKQTPGISPNCDDARGILLLIVAMLAAAIVIVTAAIEILPLIF